MLEVFSWVATALSIIGVILNAQEKISGWYVFMAADLAWAYIGYKKKIYSMVALFLFYFLLCFYGVSLWSK